MKVSKTFARWDTTDMRVEMGITSIKIYVTGNLLVSDAHLLLLLRSNCLFLYITLKLFGMICYNRLWVNLCFYQFVPQFFYLLALISHVAYCTFNVFLGCIK